MVHNDGNMLASQGATHHEETSGSATCILRARIYIRYKTGITQRKQGGIIKQGTIDASLIGTLDMDKLDVAGLERGLIDEIREATGVLDLGHTDGSTAYIGQEIGAQLGKHTRHVSQLVDILIARPVIRALGQELIVVLTLIMAGIEQILKIVEAYGIGSLALGGLCKRETRNEQQNQCQ